MKIGKYGFEHGSLIIDIAAESPAEAALLTHFWAKEHVPVICGGPYYDSSRVPGLNAPPHGLRLFMRDKSEIEWGPEIENRLGRRGILERRHKPRRRK